MNFRKISTKMIVIIIPIMIIAQGILTVISSLSSSNLIREQVADRMNAELKYKTAEINGQLESVKTMATAIATSVANTYTKTSLSEYERMLGEMIQSNDIVSGSGLWFEPYAYDAKEQYVGPYVYKDGTSLVTTYDYSNAEYDYFNQEYYINAMNSDSATITDPYYDETSDTIMSTCSTPILVNGQKIGCVTVDMVLDTIQSIVDQVSVGEAGKAMLTTADGTYLAGVVSDKIANAQKIDEDENVSLATAGAQILANEEGFTEFKEESKYNVYYDTLQGLNWKFIIYIPSHELIRPVFNLINRLVVVCIVAVVAASIIVILQIGGIAKSIATVQIFAGRLAEGDFTIEHLNVKGRDELATMSQSLNDMYGSNKGVIVNIANKSVEINESSRRLNESAGQLQRQFNNIAEYMSKVNEAMMNSSAATEELNASAEQVEKSVDVLADETGKSLSMALDIRKRADSVEKDSQESFESASRLQTNYEKQLAESIEHAKIVENIGEMAKIISDIAEQITLLSLNASIEAARAGEQGKGFAVVATEIGKLAGETSEAVSSIQSTIEEVQTAFENLASNANGLLGFVSDTVTPDYKNFVDVAFQYGKDAESFSEISETVSKMSTDIKDIMREITNAILNIAESTQNTADISANIMNSVDDVAGVVRDVTDMSQKQHEISEDLNNVVNKFKIGAD